MSDPSLAPKPHIPQRIPELDGFRAIAVWMVFVNHMMKGWPLSHTDSAWMPRWLFRIADHGWLGVDMFFILSGLLITGILIDTRGESRYFQKFYARRTLRILPLYFTCLAIMYWAYPGNASYFLACLLFVQNFVFAFGIPTPTGPGVFWSLAVEEHFYLIWPWLVRFATNRVVFIAASLLIVLTPLVRAYARSQGADMDGEIYVYSWFRFDSLALGAMLALWLRSPLFNRPFAHKLTLGFAAVFLLGTAIGYPYGVLSAGSVAAAGFRYVQAECLFAGMMVLALAYRDTPWTAILRHPFALFSAGLSYCIYLIHVSVALFYYWLLSQLGINELTAFGAPGSLFARSLFVFAVSIGLAWLSQRYLEAPFLRLKRYF